MNEYVSEIVEFSEIEKQVVLRCIEIVENTPINHAHTTYDVSVIKETIARSVSELKKHFNL